MDNQKKIDERTFDFALLIVELYKFLVGKREYVMSKQLLEAGTSIGANTHEAQAAQTRKGFIAKMNIVRPVKSKEVTFNWARKKHVRQTIG